MIDFRASLMTVMRLLLHFRHQQKEICSLQEERSMGAAALNCSPAWASELQLIQFKKYWLKEAGQPALIEFFPSDSSTTIR